DRPLLVTIVILARITELRVERHEAAARELRVGNICEHVAAAATAVEAEVQLNRVLTGKVHVVDEVREIEISGNPIHVRIERTAGVPDEDLQLVEGKLGAS